MFKSKKTKAVESIKTIIDKFCVMRLASDKVIQGLLGDIENRLGGIDQTLLETGLMQIKDLEIQGKKERIGKMIIKGFVKPDGSVLAATMIVEGANRTAAMMCYEMGLLVGVDEHGALLKSVEGKSCGVKQMALEQIEPEKPFESTDINDIPDEPAKDDLGMAEQEYMPRQEESPEPEAKTDKPIHLVWYGDCLCVPEIIEYDGTNEIDLVTCYACLEKYDVICKGGLESQTDAEKHPGAGVSQEN